MTIGTPVTKIIDNVTLSASSNQDSDGIDLSSAFGLSIGYELTFDGSATGDVTLEAYSDPDGASSSFSIGANQDYFFRKTIPVDAGNQASNVIPIPPNGKYVKIRFVNADGTYSVTGLSAWSHVKTG
ncbi:hypothetical protein [Methanosarcina acetivorans]|uniref:hypothetical protein n=1 Tax=Methanosarcina acetivorans TaxID=2214 RepID=UPI00064FE390|nr:hypothetical protein [Methanosarcina acetivorans]